MTSLGCTYRCSRIIQSDRQPAFQLKLWMTQKPNGASGMACIAEHLGGYRMMSM